MNTPEEKILKVIESKKNCFIATASEFVDNSMVAYCSEGFTLYFGSFADTLKCRNIAVNSQVAVCIDNVQLHGRAELLPYGSTDYNRVKRLYLEKFAHYDFYFELENNELYRIIPLAAWYYDSSKGTMYRDSVVFDSAYTDHLFPYKAPAVFSKRKG